MGIDVIVPVYNAAAFLNECAQSVINQTYNDWRLYLIDDGSSDGSGKICDELAETDSRISVVHQKNSGVSSARNKGLSVSCNEYFCFLDSDDLLKPDALETMLADLISHNSDAAFFNIENLYKNKTSPKPKRLESGNYDFSAVKDILVDDGTLTGILFGSACSALYKRSVILLNDISFNEAITKNEDGIFNISYISSCSSIYYDGDKYPYLYRQWKTEPNDKALCFAAVWEKTDAIITEIYEKHNCADISLERQLKSRNISVTFWSILTVANSKKGISECARFIKSVLKEHCGKNNYAYQSKSISFPKRIITLMMKYNMCFCLSIMIKKVIPIIMKR